MAETTRSGLRRVTLEMLGKARELTTVTHSEVAAVLIGKPQTALVDELTSQGADRVIVLDNTGKGPVWARSVVQALCSAVQQATPYAVLFAATADGRDLAARVAAALSLGLTGDAIDLEIDEQGRLVQLKPALGGNVVAPILSKTLPNMVTLRAGLLDPAEPEVGFQSTIHRVEVPEFAGVNRRFWKSISRKTSAPSSCLRPRWSWGWGWESEGRRAYRKSRSWPAPLGATLATTRDVVHAGWLPHQIQVGISGRTISPKVYLAVGIRGAFNHTVGIQKAGIIVAVNQTRRHTIFRSADFGVVGDWHMFLPPLVEALKPALEGV